MTTNLNLNDSYLQDKLIHKWATDLTKGMLWRCYDVSPSIYVLTGSPLRFAFRHGSVDQLKHFKNSSFSKYLSNYRHSRLRNEDFLKEAGGLKSGLAGMRRVRVCGGYTFHCVNAARGAVRQNRPWFHGYWRLCSGSKIHRPCPEPDPPRSGIRQCARLAG